MLAVTSCLVPFLLLVHFSGAYSAHFSNFVRQEDLVCPSNAYEDWSYGEPNGPDQWGETYEDCNKLHQSPININTSEVVKDSSLSKLFMANYNVPITNATVINNGHTIQITPKDGIARTIEVEGITFSLLQFHFHWGNESNRGSEHTIDSRAWAMELHFVHSDEKGSLAVVGVFFEEQEDKAESEKRSEHENKELQKIVDVLSKVQYKDETTQMESDLSLSCLIPGNPASFYHYDGSLTTPGCAEGVEWLVLKEYKQATTSQMEQFRNLHSDTRKENNEACHLVNNFRPTQCANGRAVIESE